MSDNNNNWYDPISGGGFSNEDGPYDARSGEWEEYSHEPYYDEEYSAYGEYSGEELEPVKAKKGLFRRDGAEPNKNAYMASDEDLDELEAEEEEYEMRDYHPVRFRRDRRYGFLGGLMYAVFVISISVILTCIGWMAATDVLALNKDERTAMVTIDKEDTIEDVTTKLKDAGIIEYKLLFRLFSMMSKAEEKIDPGTYELSTKFDYRALVTKMQAGSGAQQIETITFPEGYTMKQMFGLLEEKGICSVDDLKLAAATYNYSYSFLDDIAQGEPERLEGYMFPDTYDFYEGEQASSAINKFLRNFYNKITADMYVQAGNLGYSFHQIITIASMIEAEAANDAERATIASVIYNRLNAGMELGIDATIQYVLEERKAVLTEADTLIENPYNTYRYTGLPPGPVSNPGIASINAALQPDSTNYYYYALDTATGEHRFFTNYEEHRLFAETQDYVSYYMNK